MKRLVCAIVLITSISISAQAKYSGGSGTAGAPYQIATAADLLSLAANTSDYSKYFVLTADINLASNTFTTAVIAHDTDNSTDGFQGTTFTGVFDGAGHKITNLTINTSGAGNDFLGLFGYVNSGKMKNLGLENISIAGGNSHYVGGLAGYNKGTINNCYSTGTVTGEDDFAGVGGLVGAQSGGSISNCYSTAAITGVHNIDDEHKPYDIGGLVGYKAGGVISNCHSTGNVACGWDSSSLGGLVGFQSGGSISDCNSTGTITLGNNAQYAGGLVGYNHSGGTISNCYSTGNVVSGGDSSFYLGGLAGGNYESSISDCYSTGVVTGGDDSYWLGGLVGDNNSTISNCYFLITSGPDDGNGVPLTDTQMKQQSSFVGWDFVSTWQISEGISYPKLVGQSNTTVSGVIQVAKCTVTAGSKDNSDAISFSGTINAAADDLSAASSIEVTIDSNDMVNPCVKTFPINGTTLKNGKFKCSASNASFALDTKTSKFSFTAKNADLSGLSCPLTVQVEIGDYNATAAVDETTVNGTKPIPINLLMGVKNSLLVNNKPKFTKKSGVITQVAISGGFSDKNANDANLLTNPLDITIDLQTFTIPAGKFKNTSGKFTCSKVNLYDGSSNLIGVAAATFDFNKCTFTLTIKNTNFTAGPGTVDFNMEFGDFNESAVVTLP